MSKRLNGMFLVLLAACVLLITVFTAGSARAEIASGTWGGNMTWVIDDDGCLTVTGSGAISDMPSNSDGWKAYRSQIKKAVVGEGVTGIGQSAFANMESLTEVSLPDGVTSLGRSAFLRTAIRTFSIPSGVTSVPSNLFYGCDKLTSVAIHGNVTSIGESAFSGCSHLTGAIIPGSVTTVGLNAFNNCSSQLVIYADAANKPSGWQDGWNGSASVVWGRAAMENAFWNGFTGNETEVVIPGYCTTIPEWAFYDLRSTLESVVIPDSVTRIDVKAFFDCQKLTSIVIPDSVTRIDDYAFAGSGITEITIPAGVKIIGFTAFEDMSDLTAIHAEEGNPVCMSIDGVLFSKDGTMLYICPAQKTGNYAVPAGVTTLGDNAFCCSSLTSVVIPESVTSITGSCFDHCSPDLVIYADAGSKPAGWNNHWNYYSDTGALRVYFGRAGLEEAFWASLSGNETEVVIPDYCTYIPESAFYRNENLTSVTIPDSVTAIGDNAFKFCLALQQIDIPDSVASIGEWAFESCDFTEITIPAGVASIGKGAFAGIWGLTAIYADADNPYFDSADGVLFNKDHTVLVCCPTLKTTENYIIPDGVLTIAPCAFYGCELTGVTIPDSVVNLGEWAFYSCTKLTGITIPRNVTKISNGCFRSCWALTDVIIPEWVQQIDGSAFADCRGLTSVELPDGLTQISSLLFYFCHSLQSVRIPAQVESIGLGAFYGCNSLTSIVIPESVTVIEASDVQYGPFIGCSSDLVICADAESKPAGWGEYWNYYDETNTLQVYFGRAGLEAAFWSSLTGTETEVVVPDYCVSVPDEAFMGNTALTSVTLPDSIRQIGREAFSLCSALEEIQFGCGLETIDDEAFWYSGLKQVTIPASVTYIGSGAFTGGEMTAVTVDAKNTAYKSVDGVLFSKDGKTLLCCPNQKQGAYRVPDGVSRLAPYAFYGCHYLTAVDLPGSVSQIGMYAFSHCTSVTEIVIPQGVERLESNALAQCDWLTRVMLPDTLTYIGTYAFGCDCRLEEIVLPDHLTFIGDRAFAYCSALQSIVIPGSAVTVGETGAANAGPFIGCSSDFVIYADAESKPAGWSNYWNYYDETNALQVYFGRAGLEEAFWASLTGAETEVVIPDYCTYIPAEAFYWNRSLTSVTIPSGVRVIGDSAFDHCENLTSVTIPEGVKQIRTYAFWCTGLTTVTIPSSVTGIESCAFGGSPLSAIFVSDGNTAYTGGNDNVLYSIDGTKLVSFPAMKTGSYAVPEGVTEIAEFAFYNSRLTSLTLPSTLTDIGTAAFVSMENIGSITVPSGVKVIPNWCFGGCSSLTEAALPAGVTSIGSLAFTECTSLRSILIPGSVTAITAQDAGESPFCDCSPDLVIYAEAESKPAGWSNYWNYYNETNTLQVCFGRAAMETAFWAGLTGEETEVVIPDYCTAIPERAFAVNENLVSVTIPDSVKSIGDEAFCYCTSLPEIDIPAGVTGIGYGAFMNCESLVSVNVPGSVQVIRNSAFSGCISLADVTISEGVTEIETEAFLCCRSLADITIPGSVKSIGDYAFYGCTALQSVTLCEGVESIGLDVFIESGLSSINIPASLQSIGSMALCSVNIRTITVAPESTHFLVEDGVLFAGSGGTLVRCPVQKQGVYEMPYGVSTIANGAFLGCSDLTDIVMPATVYRIGDCAFRGCSSVTSFSIPMDVYSIGSCTFADCANLVSVHIPSSVISIDSFAFSNDRKLENITLPEGLTSISLGAFENCSGLKYIVIPAGVEHIAGTTFSNPNGGAFYGCTSLTIYTDAESKPENWLDGWNGSAPVVWSRAGLEEAFWESLTGEETEVVIPDYCTYIPGCAFQNNRDLTSVTIPEGITHIDLAAFEGCTGLTGIIIPDSVTSIGESAFAGCSSLVSVTLPCGLTRLENYLFCGCGSLERITIPGSVVKIGYNVFEDCTGLTTVMIPSGVLQIEAAVASESPFTGCCGLLIYVQAGSVPAGWSEYWNYCSDTETCAVRFSVAPQEETFWAGLTGEETAVVIPDYCTFIPDYAFANNTVLQSVTIPGSVTEIGDGAFNYCTALTSVNIPEGVTALGDYVFGDCYALAQISLPSTLTSFGEYAFYGCTKLTALTIPAGVTEIPTGSFGDDFKLETVVIPSGVTSIGYGAFNSCERLTGVTVPESVTSIGDYAFYGCTSLGEITLPKEITEIGYRAFDECGGLTAYVIRYSCADDYCADNSITRVRTELVTSVNPAFNGQDGSVVIWGEPLARVIGGDNVLTLPASLTAVSSSAFIGMSAQQVEIPSGCRSIGNWAFVNCKSLRLIIIPASVRSISGSAFDGCGELVIYCPAGSYAERYAKSHNIPYLTFE